MPAHYVTMSLDELRSSRAPKYDVTFKMVFSLEGSALRKMLDIPQGLNLSEEFPDLDGLRVDSLTFSPGHIHHLEFQSRNHSDMIRRMYQYYMKIKTRPDIVRLMARDNTVIDQQVLYVGTPAMNMMSDLTKNGDVVYSYILNDLRWFHEHRDTLRNSDYPEDWVLSLLVENGDHSEQDWLNVALQIDECEDANKYWRQEYWTILLIASILRGIPEHVQEEISRMIEIDVRDNRLLRQVYEQGQQTTLTLLTLVKVEKLARRNELKNYDELLALMQDADAEVVEAFSEALEDAAQKQGVIDAYNAKYQTGPKGPGMP